VPVLLLENGKTAVLTACIASLVGLVLLVPVAHAQGSGDDQYGCGIGGCPSGGSSGGNDGTTGSHHGLAGSRDAPASGGGGGSGTSGSGGARNGGASLGPTDTVVGPGDGGSRGGARNGKEGSLSDATAGSDGRGSSDAHGSSPGKGGGQHSFGQLLSASTEPIATGSQAASPQRAAKTVGPGSGGSGLLWLLLALGAITAVAAAGVAVRRRHARNGYDG
jgi:hypothetical protein